MFDFFRNRKYREMIKKCSTLALDDFATIINNTIKNLEREERIKNPLHEEILKLESTAIVFWFFRYSNVFSEPIMRLMIDEVHQQYLLALKRNGYNRDQAQFVCDELNIRYKTYDEFVSQAEDFVNVGIYFARFVSENAKTELDLTESVITIDLIEQTGLKFKEWRKIMEI